MLDRLKADYRDDPQHLEIIGEVEEFARPWLARPNRPPRRILGSLI
jgi:hypothetical protein